jgi:hypothetical protein
MTSLNVPQDIPISFYLLKQCKLWVWDFDDTLIDTATYLKKDMSPDAILKRCDAELDQEIPQWRYFRKLVEFLVMHGRYVGIASFGTYEIIQAYMKRIMGFNQQFFTKKNIIAPCMKARETYRFNIPPNKNEYIYTLMRIYRVQDFKRVVLFDDKPSNVSDAIAIGIVGIQIATPANGDNPNGGKMYFGPWIMDDFDKQIQKTCGDEIYLNRNYSGMASKENYIGYAYDNNNQQINSNVNSGKRKGKGHNLAQNEINYGTGIRAKNNYFQEPYDFSLDVDDSSIYKPVAFGTGIGDRKVLTNPQFRWNGYKNSQKMMPKWYNGNYVNVPGLVNTEGYWNEDSALGGASMSYWDTHQKVMNNDPPGAEHINSQNKDLSDSEEDTVLDVAEGFYGNGAHGDCGCRKFEWNWIILLLVLLIVVMMVIAIRC